MRPYKNRPARTYVWCRLSVVGGRRATFPRSPAVSSPRRGLTSLFGMGRGAPPRHSRHLSLAACPGRRESPVGHSYLLFRTSAHAFHDRVAFASFAFGCLAQGPAGGLPRAAASFRAISAARLNVSPRSHLRPIDVVVCHGPQRRPHLGAGFALRCPQRLSPPDAATRLRAWRHDRHTVGPSDPVLSY